MNVSEDDIDEIEYLNDRITDLSEVEDLAFEVNPRGKMYRDIAKIVADSRVRFMYLARKALGRSASLGAAGERHPLEKLERIFAKLRNRAEQDMAREAKLEGKRARFLRKSIAATERVTREVAKALMLEAEERGILDDDYIADHGLEPWVF